VKRRQCKDAARRGGGSALPPELEPPRGLVAYRFDVGGDAFAVLEFPMESVVPRRVTSNLTASERSVVELMLEGKTNLEIAEARRRALRTVANQVASIFRKLGIGSRSELYAFAARSRDPDPE